MEDAGLLEWIQVFQLKGLENEIGFFTHQLYKTEQVGP